MIDLQKTLQSHRDGIPLRLVDPTTGDEGTVYIRPTVDNLAFQARLSELEASFRAGRILEIHDDREASALLGACLRRMRGGAVESPGEPEGGDADGTESMDFHAAAWQYDQLTASPAGRRVEHRRRAMPGTVLVGWIEADFGVPYSEEHAAAMLEIPWIWQQVEAAVRRADEVDAGLREVLKKRVEGPFDGGSDGGRTSGASKSAPTKRKRSTGRKSKPRAGSPKSDGSEP